LILHIKLFFQKLEKYYLKIDLFFRKYNLFVVFKIILGFKMKLRHGNGVINITILRMYIKFLNATYLNNVTLSAFLGIQQTMRSLVELITTIWHYFANVNINLIDI